MTKEIATSITSTAMKIGSYD